MVVGKVGTVPIEMDELLEVLSTERTPSQRHKICTIDEILKRAEQWRASKERIAFTEYSFDVLHVAQLSYLERARSLGEHLVVAVSANDSEGSTRGMSRPHTPAFDQARLLAALECVDAVVLIEPDKTPDCVKLLQPDLILREDDLAESLTSVIDKVENYA